MNQVPPLRTAEQECDRAQAEHVTERAELARRWRGSWRYWLQGLGAAGASMAFVGATAGWHTAQVMGWTYAGWFGGVALFALFVWARTVRGWLHHHNGYVAMAGNVWGCSVCGKLPRDCLAQVAEAKQAQAARFRQGIYW